MTEGWVRLHHKIREWRWKTEPLTGWLFVRLIELANWTDSTMGTVTIKRGQCPWSLRQLSAETGISMRSLRTSINRLKSTQEITQDTTHGFSIITICNYDKYNPLTEETDIGNDTDNDTRPTHDRHTTDTIIRRIRRKEDNIYIPEPSTNGHKPKPRSKPKKPCEPKKPYGQFGRVMLTDQEYRNLLRDFGSEEEREYWIMTLDEGKEMKPAIYKYANDNLAIRKWRRNSLSKGN